MPYFPLCQSSGINELGDTLQKFGGSRSWCAIPGMSAPPNAAPHRWFTRWVHPHLRSTLDARSLAIVSVRALGAVSTRGLTGSGSDGATAGK